MSDQPDIDVLLRRGLRDLPSPTVAADFDDAVLASVRQPRPWWQSLWMSASPMLSGGACAFVAVVALVVTMTHLSPPDATMGTNIAAPSSPVARQIEAPATSVAFDIDRLIDKANLRSSDVWTIRMQPVARPKSTLERRPNTPIDKPRGVGMRPFRTSSLIA